METKQQVTVAEPVHWCLYPDVSSRRLARESPGASRSATPETGRKRTGARDDQRKCGDDHLLDRSGTAGSEGRRPSLGHHFTLAVQENQEGVHEMFFMDTSGGREMTLIAKKPIPTRWGAGDAPIRSKKTHQAANEVFKSLTRSSPVPTDRDQTYVLGIAHKVQARLALELLEAKALLARERQLSAEMAAEIDPVRLRQVSSSLGTHHLDGSISFLNHEKSRTRTDTQSKFALSSQSSGTAERRTQLMSTDKKVHHTFPNPKRYRSPPTSDALVRSSFARGRGLDPITGVTRTATWRLQNQWLGGLNWKEFNTDKTNDEEISTEQEGFLSDIDGRVAAERLLHERLAVLAGDEAQHADATCRLQHDSANKSPGTAESRATNSSEAHVEGVRHARLQAFKECFDSLISRFQIYAPLLSRIKREFDGLIDAFETSIDDITARKVAPAAMQTDQLKNLVSSSEKLIENLKNKIRALENEAQQREKQVQKLTQVNSESRTMIGTRKIQSRRSDQDFIKQSMHNDTMTMKNFELQGFQAKQSSTRQQILKSEKAIVAMEEDGAQLLQEEEELQKELEKLTLEHGETYESACALVQQHCHASSESWDMQDFLRVLMAMEGPKTSNHAIFEAVRDAARSRSAARARRAGHFHRATSSQSSIGDKQ